MTIEIVSPNTIAVLLHGEKVNLVEVHLPFSQHAKLRSIQFIHNCGAVS